MKIKEVTEMDSVLGLFVSLLVTAFKSCLLDLVLEKSKEVCGARKEQGNLWACNHLASDELK